MTNKAPRSSESLGLILLAQLLVKVCLIIDIYTAYRYVVHFNPRLWTKSPLCAPKTIHLEIFLQVRFVLITHLTIVECVII